MRLMRVPGRTTRTSIYVRVFFRVRNQHLVRTGRSGTATSCEVPGGNESSPCLKKRGLLLLTYGICKRYKMIERSAQWCKWRFCWVVAIIGRIICVLIVVIIMLTTLCSGLAYYSARFFRFWFLFFRFRFLFLFWRFSIFGGFFLRAWKGPVMVNSDRGWPFFRFGRRLSLFGLVNRNRPVGPVRPLKISAPGRWRFLDTIKIRGTYFLTDWWIEDWILLVQSIGTNTAGWLEAG